MWLYLSRGKIEIPRNVRNSKSGSGDMTSSEETGLNIRTNVNQNRTGPGVRRTLYESCMEFSRKSVKT